MFPKPYLVFVGEQSSATAANTALLVRRWAAHDCIGQWRLAPQALDLELADMDPAEAAALGARSLLLAIDPLDGQFPRAWVAPCIEAMEQGLDIVSSLRARLTHIRAIAVAALRLGRSLHEVRHAAMSFPDATGRKRTGLRLLTVGTDCGQGKKYTALALTEALRERGLAADFRAAGKTGLLISGSGVMFDDVPAHYIAGAAESLSPDAADDHWDIIEGRGAIYHPAHAGISLSQLRGSQPDMLVLCHDPRKHAIGHYPGFKLRPLRETMQTYTSLARVTNPKARFVAISLNTYGLPLAVARRHCQHLEDQHGLPCFDPLRFGLEKLVERMSTAPVPTMGTTGTRRQGTARYAPEVV